MQDTIYFARSNNYLFVDKSDTSMQWEEGEGGSREGGMPVG